MIEFARTTYGPVYTTFAPPKGHEEVLPEVEVVAEKAHDEDGWGRARIEFTFRGSFPRPLSPSQAFALSQVLATASRMGHEMNHIHGAPPDPIPELEEADAPEA